MKKRIVCIFLSVFFAVCCLFGCAKKKTDEELVRERIDTFVTKYNDGDFEGVLECFDAKTRNTLQATFNVMGGLVGGLTGFSFDLGDLFTLGVAMMGGEVLAIEVSEVSIDGANAVATAQMGYADIGEESIENVYIILVKEEEDWFIQDMQDEPPAGTETDDSTNNGGGTTSSQSGYKITNVFRSEAGYFMDGYGCVKYSKNNKNYYGFINTSGKILYSEEVVNGQEIFVIGKGGYLIVTNETCKVIGSGGKVKATLTGEYEVKADGGGYAFLYQDASDISTVKHLYGVIDYNGNWVEPLEDLGASGKWDNLAYIGDGMFAVRDSEYLISKVTSTGVVGVATLTNLKYNRSLAFKNGIAHVPMNNFSGGNTTLDNGTEHSISSDFILKTDGSYTEIDTPAIYTDGKALYMQDGYYKIIDYTKATPTSATYTNYPTSQITGVEFVGEYGLVKINGVDGKKYFTVINAQGQEQYTPKEYDSWYTVYLFADGNVYHNGKHFSKTGVEKAVDYVDYSDAERKYLIKGNSSSGYAYYKANGEKLFESLHK